MRRFPWLSYLLVALAAILPHLQTLGFEFVFDDDFLVVRNGFLHEPWSALRAFATHFWVGTPFGALYYRPLVTASLALNGRLFGWGPTGFHLVNLLLHAANSVLVVWLLRRLGSGQLPALFVGAFFALHPVAAWPVGSIVARVDLLPAFFVLLAWVCFTGGERAARSGERPGPLRSLAVGGLFLLALLSKESALAFLAIPVLAWRAPRDADDPLAERVRARFVALATASCAAAVGAAVLLRLAVGMSLSYGLDQLSPITNPLAFQPLPGRWLAALALAGRYFLYLFVPFRFADPRDQRLGGTTPTLADGWVVGTLVLMAVWIAAIKILWLRRDRRARPLAFALAAFLPASNLIVPIGSLYAQNFLYMPLLGVTVVFGETLVRRAGGQADAGRRAGLGALARWPALPLLAVLGAASARETAIWRNDLTLMGAWVERFPYYSLAQGALGLGLLQRGHEPEAERRFRAAIDLDARNIEAQYNLGLLLIAGDRGRDAIEEGLEHSRAALALNPSLVAAQVNAANALLRLERPVEAEAEARAALALEPGLVPARRNLAESLFREGRFAEAAIEFDVLVAAFPDDSEIRSPWIVSLIRAGDLVAARREAERARRAFPDLPWFDFCLARVEARSGNPDAALALLTSAARAPELGEWLGKVADFEPYRGRPGYAEMLPAPRPGRSETREE